MSGSVPRLTKLFHRLFDENEGEARNARTSFLKVCRSYNVKPVDLIVDLLNIEEEDEDAGLKVAKMYADHQDAKYRPVITALKEQVAALTRERSTLLRQAGRLRNEKTAKDEEILNLQRKINDLSDQLRAATSAAPPVAEPAPEPAKPRPEQAPEEPAPKRRGGKPGRPKGLNISKTAEGHWKWNDVVLPSGTLTRIIYREVEFRGAIIEGDLVFEGEVVTPYGFLVEVKRRIDGDGHNAGTAVSYLQVRRPFDDRWLPIRSLQRK